MVFLGCATELFSTGTMMPQRSLGIDVQTREFSEGLGEAMEGVFLEWWTESCAGLGAREILLLCIATPSWTIFRTPATWAPSMWLLLPFPWRTPYAAIF